MARHVQGDGADQREQKPREPRDGKGLLLGERTRLEVGKAQSRPDEQRDAYAEQIPLGRVPFLHHDGSGKRHAQGHGQKHGQSTQIVRDDAQIGECEALPHGYPITTLTTTTMATSPRRNSENALPRIITLWSVFLTAF